MGEGPRHVGIYLARGCKKPANPSSPRSQHLAHINPTPTLHPFYILKHLIARYYYAQPQCTLCISPRVGAHKTRQWRTCASRQVRGWGYAAGSANGAGKPPLCRKSQSMWAGVTHTQHRSKIQNTQMYVYIYIYIYVIHAYIHIHIYICVCLCKYSHPVYAHIQICVHTYMYMYIYINIHILCTLLCIHIYVHLHMICMCLYVHMYAVLIYV